MSDTITFTVAQADVESALKKALLERSPYSHDEAPLLQAARHVVNGYRKNLIDLISSQVRDLVDDKAVASAIRERLLAALTQAVEEKAGSIVRSMSKADIAKLLAPSLEGLEP